MIELTDDQASVSEQGYPVRVLVPEWVGTSSSFSQLNGKAPSRASRKRSTRSASKRPWATRQAQRFPG